MLKILEAQTGGGLAAWIPTIGIWVGFIVLFYFMFMRPRKKQQEKVQAMRENIRKGVKVTTIGGFIGTVVSIHDNEVVINSNGTKLRLLKAAIADVTDERGAKPAEVEEVINEEVVEEE